jgi:hypothetical protein
MARREPDCHCCDDAFHAVDAGHQIWERLAGQFSVRTHLQQNGPSGISVGNRVAICHDPATASRASRAERGAYGAPGPRDVLVA